MREIYKTNANFFPGQALKNFAPVAHVNGGVGVELQSSNPMLWPHRARADHMKNETGQLIFN